MQPNTATICSRDPVALQDVVISQELRTRHLRKVTGRGEFAAMHALASALTQSSSMVLKRLAKLAIELCNAGSSGVSVIEANPDGEQIFRWQALAGVLEQHEGGTTPRDWSPCGQCLKTGKAILYSYPARYFTYFQELDIPIVEGLVIPMYLDGLAVGTIWIISHDETCRFDAEDVRVMTSLGSFATAALRFAFIGPASGENRAAAGHELAAPQYPDQSVDPTRVARAIVWGEYIRRIAGGDHFALGALCDETSPLVFSTALRIVSFRADAEEVTSDVYARVWRLAKTYDARRGGIEAWLVSIARNRAIDRLRSRAARDRSETALLIECSSAVNPESSAAASQTRTHLLQALQTLPFEQRRAIELAYFSGLTMTEIAEQLGHPVGSVKTRVRMGLMRLRLLLAAVAS